MLVMTKSGLAAEVEVFDTEHHSYVISDGRCEYIKDDGERCKRKSTEVFSAPGDNGFGENFCRQHYDKVDAEIACGGCEYIKGVGLKLIPYAKQNEKPASISEKLPVHENLEPVAEAPAPERVKEAMPKFKGQTGPFMNWDSAVSQARLASKQFDKPLYIWQCKTGYFAKQCIVHPTEKASDNFVRMEGYNNGTLCYPLNKIAKFGSKRTIFAYGDLASAREKATAASLLYTGVVYLARSTKPHKSLPWIVFTNGMVPHESMTCVCEYTNGCEQYNTKLDLNDLPKEVAVKDTVFAVTYLDAEDNAHVAYIQAASAEDAEYLARSGYEKEDGTIVGHAGFRIKETEEVANESSEETIRKMKDYAREMLRYGAHGEYSKKKPNWQEWEDGHDEENEAEAA
jgi:hypothetical protein